MTTFDVVVIGGGPAGSVCAAALAALGRRVVVLERDRHPRFHVGESLLPASLGVLEAVGVLDAVRARFLVKRGARFLDADDPRRSVRYAFADAFGAKWDHAFNVPRDEFDELLFRHAGTCGADLREGWEAARVAFEGGRAVGVEARDERRGEAKLGARFVVDASGRAALIPRSLGRAAPIAQLDRTAIFVQVRGAWRDQGEREGDLQIILFGEGDQRGWLWNIPFADGRGSTGAVVSSAWVRAHKTDGGAPSLLDAALGQAPAAREMLKAAEPLFSPRAAADFSFRVDATRGGAWLAVGDAAGFIDPLFSTGAHLAMYGALGAANAIHLWLDDEESGEIALASWESELRRGADLFLGVVQAFYAGELTPYLFAESQHPFLTRAITSMLSGIVFDDARWIREMRARFPVRR